MRFDAFVGPSYTPFSRIADSQRCVNLFPEIVQSGQGPNRMYLRNTPGRSAPLGTIDGPVRCLWAGDNRLFAVGGASYYEVLPTFDPNGVLSKLTPQKRGTVNLASTPAQIFPNGTQLFIVSSGQGYIDVGGNTPIAPVIPAVTGAFIDGYFVAGQPNSPQFNISDLSVQTGGLNWNPLDFGVKQGYPDDIAAVFAAYDLLWLFGFQTTEVWYDSGNNNFPFQRIQGAFFQVGCLAQFSVAQVGNTIMWLGSVQGGKAQVFQAQGYSFPVRASNHALETAIQGYPTVLDAVAYSYEEEGHVFYVLTFPSGDATWVYDQTTGQWHQRGTWDAAKGIFHADLLGGQTHAYVFGQHLVGDSVSGNIYAQSNTTYTDNTAAIRRVRAAPHLTDENKRSRYGRFELFMQKGTVPAGTSPEMMLRYSDDGGFRWSNIKTATVGSTGEYGHRVIWRQLGSGRDRVYEISTSEDIPIALVDAFLQVTPGTD